MQANVQGASKQSTLSLSKAVRQEQTLAIVGVDFDPPLDYVDALRKRGIMLLVAVENRSNTTIKGARIVARLGGVDRKALERSGVLPHLPPHTIVVYRFPRMRNIPIRDLYTLTIEVYAAQSQQTLSVRHYTVRITERK